MGLLLDLEPTGRELPPAPEREPEARPGDLEMLGRGLLGLPRYPLRAIRSLPRAVPNLEDTPFGTLARRGDDRAHRRPPELWASAVRASLRAPKTSFNGRVSPHRRFAFGQLPLDDVKAVKNEHGCTVNDVVVSMCAGVVRRWLVEHSSCRTSRSSPRFPSRSGPATRPAPTATGSC